LGLLGHLAGFSHTLALVAGVLMILVGISMLGITPAAFAGSRFFRIPTSFLRRVGRLISAEGAGNRFFLGLGLGFLPCGLIYAALLKAMATGSALYGAATMAAFGLGTAGALLALGMFSSAIRIRLNRWGRQFAAVGVGLMGIVLVVRAAMPGMLMLGSHTHACH
jgi:sulfite exporter TauE/SafE